MKKVLVPFIMMLIGFVFFNCGTKHQSKATQTPVQLLFKQLKAVNSNGVLFGHQDDLAYGVTWKYEDGRSDTYETAGDYPALFGWELGGIELGHQVNLDSVPFNKMRDFVVKGYNKGGVITFSWHPYSPLDTTKNAWTTNTEVVKYIIPGGSHHEAFKRQLGKVAAFFASLRTDGGKRIPFIFRPWHEMDGNWFWWGSSLCKPEEFQQLFCFTIEYLRNEKKLDFLVAYSPDNHFLTEDEYLTWYPGDDVVDIVGMDNYGDFRIGSVSVEAARKKLEIVTTYARKKDKIAAFTESGLNTMPDKNWFTQKLEKSFLEDPLAFEIAYVMLWRNADTTHFFSTYSGHPSAADFRKFITNKKIWLLKDWNAFKKENNLQ
jgi:mannan endo-1,4-beta-mannosidase